MFIVYRLVDTKGEMLSDADSIEHLKGILGPFGPGPVHGRSDRLGAIAIGPHGEAVGRLAQA